MTGYILTYIAGILCGAVGFGLFMFIAINRSV